MSEDIQRALGRIEGKIDLMQSTQASHDAKLDNINKRVTKNEIHAAGSGAITGGLMAAFVVLLKNTLHIG